MSYKKKIYWILLSSIAGFVIAVVMTSPSSLGLCPAGDRFCFDPYDEIVGQPLGIFSILLFFLSLLLLVMREQIFYSWSKFAIIFLPIAIVLIGVAPTINGTLIGFDKESAAYFLATIFAIVSIIIIAVNFFKLRGKEN